MADTWAVERSGAPEHIEYRVATTGSDGQTAADERVLDLVGKGQVFLVHNQMARLVKEICDRTFAALVLLVALPVILVIVLAVRISSPGPAFYTQTRIGREGRPFRFYKFRTMVDGADELLPELVAHNDCDGVLFKMKADPRTTTIGRFLRRYSLDELPQLWNVLNGTMSVVGPRPALPAEVEAYDEAMRRHRHQVKPGLTGLWQVSGRSDLSWDESVELDLHYVHNWSLGMDTRILVRTIPAVLAGRGAY